MILHYLFVWLIVLLTKQGKPTNEFIYSLTHLTSVQCCRRCGRNMTRSTPHSRLPSPTRSSISGSRERIRGPSPATGRPPRPRRQVTMPITQNVADKCGAGQPVVAVDQLHHLGGEQPGCAGQPDPARPRCSQVKIWPRVAVNVLENFAYLFSFGWDLLSGWWVGVLVENC